MVLVLFRQRAFSPILVKRLETVLIILPQKRTQMRCDLPRGVLTSLKVYQTAH